MAQPSRVDLDSNETPDKERNDIREITHLGYRIYFGGNALSNENLIDNHAHRDCIWFHASFSRGTHVILCWEGSQVPSEEVMRRAAGLALEHSKSFLKEVAYAPLRDVYHPENSKPGIYRTWRQEKIIL